MFLHLSVILFTGKGFSVQGRRPLPGGDLCQKDPPYGNEPVVRIALECFLVLLYIVMSRNTGPFESFAPPESPNLLLYRFYFSHFNFCNF